MNATQEQAVAETSVFWDIKTCPVPPECDAGVVGRCIKRYVKKLGYSGRLTIVAVGLLTDVSDDVLRAFSSSGLVLNHVPLGSIGILRTMYAWKQTYPPPTNMMLISSNPSILPQIRYSCGYNIFQLFPYDSTNAESLWKDFLLQDSGEEDKCSETDESADWLCSVCTNHVCEGFENFTTHLSSQEHEHKATQIDEAAVAVTSVLWDINGCPVPPDCDARRVHSSIKQYLEDFGYSGPLTINAIGLLTDVPCDVLRAVSSTGIVLKHIAYNSADIMYKWTCLNPPPANVVVLCPYSEAYADLVADLQESGYNIIELFPYSSSYSESLWKNFLLEGTSEENKCCETGEHASWVCSFCDDIPGEGFENFIAHLSSQEHKQKATQILEEAVAETLVLWNINTCPVPPDCDARRVRPRIKQYLEDLGYSGPVTINAIGLLTDVPRDVLRAVSSTGIGLKHITYNTGDIFSIMYQWIHLNPRPVNMMVICPYSEVLAKVVCDLQKWGCRMIELFSYNSPYSESLWEKFLLEGTLEGEGKCSETGEDASWVCSVFHDISGKGFDNFITHISSQEHEKHEEHEPEIVTAVTVFWDIKGFPVPPDYDARQVGLLIKEYLEDFGLSGPITINAMGLLTDVPLDVLRAVSSTGIVLNHGAFNSTDIMYKWARLNRPPANTVVIFPYSEALAKVVTDLKVLGYTIIWLFPFNSLYSECLWKEFLLEASGTLAEEDKGSETGEDASWVCSVCHDIPGKGFDNFVSHLSQEHELKSDEKDEEAVEAGVEATILKKHRKARKYRKARKLRKRKHY